MRALLGAWEALHRPSTASKGDRQSQYLVHPLALNSLTLAVHSLLYCSLWRAPLTDMLHKAVVAHLEDQPLSRDNLFKNLCVLLASLQYMHVAQN